ncbi:hypothetical protein AVEN_141850-1, partial [Araneus ventricosus]
GKKKIRIACGMRPSSGVDVGSADLKSSHAVDECSAIFFMISWEWNSTS